MIRNEICRAVEAAALEAQRKGLLPDAALPEITVEHPPESHGDFACAFALKFARTARRSPMDIARTVIAVMQDIPEVEKVEVAAPGFINFTLKGAWLAEQVDQILQQGESFGNLDLGEGVKVQLEFVSVNPTGPLHVGHGRGAILGNTLANVLRAAGYFVEKEYYVNDAGAQMEAFYSSLYVRYQQCFGMDAEVPEEGYHGDYLVDLAGQIAEEKGDVFLRMSLDKAVAEIGVLGLDKIIEGIRGDLGRLGVVFDVWFSEKMLYTGGQYESAMNLIREKGYVVEKEGAVWFVSSEMGEDKDNVLIRSNGTPTYFASDVAYHYNKFVQRKFDRVINIWGADHQGHVPRMKAVMRALDLDPDRLQIIITQMVTLKRGDIEIKISKRAGDIITLSDLVDEVGADACRFFFLSRSLDSQMDFDLELAKKQSADNPVYYVQYAHARIASILRLAQEKGIGFQDGDVSLLVSDPELAYIRKMLEFPEIVEIVSDRLEPHHLTYYAQDLATAFHSFYKQCRVISEDPKLTAARLKLIQSARLVFARTLHLMGMNAPDRM